MRQSNKRDSAAHARIRELQALNEQLLEAVLLARRFIRLSNVAECTAAQAAVLQTLDTVVDRSIEEGLGK